MSLLGMMGKAVIVASFSMGNTNTIDLSTFKKLYVETARAYLETIKGVLDGTVTSEDNTPLEQLHIAFHSLKSQSTAMGFQQTALFCGVLETFLKSRIDQQHVLSDAEQQVLIHAHDSLSESLTTIDTENRETITQPLLTTLKQSLTQQ
jgi:chemotaxis protein histidine kinase CheA